MTNPKEAFRTALNVSGVTALVPIASIMGTWPDIEPTLPCIVFQLIDYTPDDYRDDKVGSDVADIEAQIFVAPGKSTAAIYQAMTTALEAVGWSRTYAADLPDLSSKANRLVTRWTATYWR